MVTVPIVTAFTGNALKCKMQKDQFISTYVRYDIMNLLYDIKLLRNLYYYRIKLEANPRVNIP